MIGPISNSYTGVQWPSYQNRARSSVPAEAAPPLAHKPANPEVPVQPTEAAAPVTAKATGTLHGGLPARGGVDPAEMAVRARISPVEPQAGDGKALPGWDDGAQTAAPLQGPGGERTAPAALGAEEEAAAAPLPGAEEENIPAAFGGKGEEAAGAADIEGEPGRELREKLEADKAERQERAEERVRQQEEAQVQREEFANDRKAEEEARVERLEALRGSAEAENGRRGTGEEQAPPEQGGYLQLDHTAALLRNHQMTNLLTQHLSGQAKGQDTAPLRDAIDALFQNGQQRVRFGGEEDNPLAHRQRANGYVTQRKSPFAVA